MIKLFLFIYCIISLAYSASGDDSQCGFLSSGCVNATIISRTRSNQISVCVNSDFNEQLEELAISRQGHHDSFHGDQGNTVCTAGRTCIFDNGTTERQVLYVNPRSNPPGRLSYRPFEGDFHAEDASFVCPRSLKNVGVTGHDPFLPFDQLNSIDPKASANQRYHAEKKAFVGCKLAAQKHKDPREVVGIVYHTHTTSAPCERCSEFLLERADEYMGAPVISSSSRSYKGSRGHHDTRRDKNIRCNTPGQEICEACEAFTADDD